MRPDSLSSSFHPVLPMCGAVAIHLAVVAGIGQRLLVTRHAGREDTRQGLANGAKRQSVEGAAVLKHQERRRRDSTTEVSGALSAANMTALSCLKGPR